MSRPLTPSDGHPEGTSEYSAKEDSSSLGGDTGYAQASQRHGFRFRVLIAIGVLAIATFSILPNYWTGDWVWSSPPELAQASQLNRLQAEGLDLPGWNMLEQRTVLISGSKWSIQAIQPRLDKIEQEIESPAFVEYGDRPILLMLRPQVWYREQPQVEWIDINGVQQWTADHRQTLWVDDLEPGYGDRPVSFHARYFRGWNRQQTYAVVQWYAWSTGGSPAIRRWFWADQWKQLRDRQRMPWVAVSVLIPIQPVGDINTVRTVAKTVSQTIQATLIHDVFTEPS